VEIRDNFTCVPCIPSNNPRSLYALSASAGYRYVIQGLAWPRCAPGLAILGTSGGNGVLSTIRETLAMPNATSTRLTTAACTDSKSVLYQYLYATHWFIDEPFLLATIRCLPVYAFTEPQLIPRVVQVHLVTSSDVASAAAVAILGGIWKQAPRQTPTVVTFTFAGRDPTRTSLAFSTARHSFVEVQQWLTDVGVFLAPNSSLLTATCGAGIDFAFAANLSPSHLLIVGDVATSCTASNRLFHDELRNLTSTSPSIGIFWITQRGTVPPFAFGATFPTIDTALDSVFSSFSTFVKERSSVVCSGAITFAPERIPVGHRSKLTFRGICDFVSICFAGEAGTACTQQLSVTGQRAWTFTPLFLFPGEYRVLIESRSSLPNNPVILVPAKNLTVLPVNANDAPFAARRKESYQIVRGYGLRQLEPIVQVGFKQVVQDLWSSSVSLLTSSNSSQKLMNSKPTICCTVTALATSSLNAAAVSGVGMGVTSDVASAAFQCFGGSSGLSAVDLPVPNWTSPLNSKEAMSLAVRCLPPRVVDPLFPVVNSRTMGLSDVIMTLQPRRRGGQTSANSPADVQIGDIKRQRIEAMTEYLRSKATSISRGLALRRIYEAVTSIGLRSSYPSEERTCEPGEVPLAGSRCFYPWSAIASDAGAYLAASGFSPIPTDWYMSNALVGDIVVIPSTTFLDEFSGDAVEYSKGHIMMKFNDSASGRDWIGDAISSHNVFLGALDSPTALPPLVLYRLRDDAEITADDGEVIVPFTGSSDTVSYAVAWTGQWAQYDAYVTPLDSVTDSVEQHFSCPSTNIGAFPQQLWSFPLHPEMNKVASICYRLFPGGGRLYGVRCCYDGEGSYIFSWPSQVEYQVEKGPRSIENTIDAELVACLRPGRSSDACKIYRQRRPAPPSTNTPYRGTMKWSPSVQWGAAFGDPHCKSYDGVPFECNFQGEAVWTACGNWTVHAVADAVSQGSSATVITRVAVRSDADVFFGLLDNSSETGFSLYLNNVRLQSTGQASGDKLAVIIDNRTVTVLDDAGNIVRLIFDVPLLIVLATVPSPTSCSNRTTGLCGNNNGVAADDLLPNNPSADNAPLALNSTNATIYVDFVLSWLVLSLDKSLFPQPLYFQGNLSFRPVFASADLLADCPAACRNDSSCCFDVAVGGEVFAESFNAAKSVFNAAEAQAVLAEVAAAAAKRAAFEAQFLDVPGSLQLPEKLQNTDVITLDYTLRFDPEAQELLALTCNVCPDYSMTVAAMVSLLSASGITTSFPEAAAGGFGYTGCLPAVALAGNRTQLTVKVTEVVAAFRVSCFGVVAMKSPEGSQSNARYNASDIIVLRATTAVAIYVNLFVSTPVPLSQQVPPVEVGPGEAPPGFVARWTPAPLSGSQRAAPLQMIVTTASIGLLLMLLL
jgi:hypothetical protein